MMIENFIQLATEFNKLERNGYSKESACNLLKEDIIKILKIPKKYTHEEQQFILSDNSIYEIWKYSALNSSILDCYCNYGKYCDNLINNTYYPEQYKYIFPSTLFKNGIMIIRPITINSKDQYPIKSLFFLKSETSEYSLLERKTKYFYSPMENKILFNENQVESFNIRNLSCWKNFTYLNLCIADKGWYQIVGVSSTNIEIEG